MKYLLDTNVILWWLTDFKKLSTEVQNIISNRENKIYVSSISLWEMAIKKDIKKLTIPINILTILETESFKILPLKAEESLAIIDLPKIHNDPFDRILIAQAKLNDLIFITKDKKIQVIPS